MSSAAQRGTTYLLRRCFLRHALLRSRFFLAAGFADLASALGSSTATAATLFGFATFFGNSGAEKVCPLNAISVMRTELNGWR